MGHRLTLAAGVTFSIALLSWLIGSHWDQLAALWDQVRLDYLALSVASAACAYLFLGAAQWEILRLLGYGVRYREMAGISMAGVAANTVLGFSGATGVALRAHLLKRRGVPYGKTLSLVVVYALCMSATLALLAGQGLLISILHLQGDPLPWKTSSISVIGPILVTFGLAATIFHHELRSRWSRRAFRTLNRVVYIMSRREIPEHHFELFDQDLTIGLRKIWEKRGHLTKTVAFICLDWMCAFGVLYFAFRALEVDVGTGPLILGFALGVATTSIPFLPGGLGVMEGSMAGVFTKFDVDFGAALLAALVFRVVYHILPVLASLAIYPWLDATGRAAGNRGVGATS
jgi:uncharacterized protein (TIRG00374 family)